LKLTLAGLLDEATTDIRAKMAENGAINFKVEKNRKTGQPPL
jgi:hypothetical protein